MASNQSTVRSQAQAEGTNGSEPQHQPQYQRQRQRQRSMLATSSHSHIHDNNDDHPQHHHNHHPFDLRRQPTTNNRFDTTQSLSPSPSSPNNSRSQSQTQHTTPQVQYNSAQTPPSQQTHRPQTTEHLNNLRGGIVADWIHAVPSRRQRHRHRQHRIIVAEAARCFGVGEIKSELEDSRGLYHVPIAVRVAVSGPTHGGQGGNANANANANGKGKGNGRRVWSGSDTGNDSGSGRGSRKGHRMTDDLVGVGSWVSEYDET